MNLLREQIEYFDKAWVEDSLRIVKYREDSLARAKLRLASSANSVRIRRDSIRWTNIDKGFSKISNMWISGGFGPNAGGGSLSIQYGNRIISCQSIWSFVSDIGGVGLLYGLVTRRRFGMASISNRHRPSKPGEVTIKNS